MPYRKAVLRRMPLLLTAMDIPVYSTITLVVSKQNLELLLIILTVCFKTALVYLEYREAKRKLLLHEYKVETIVRKQD